ncbi:staphylopine family metallophore export MFS transporter CntE [Domibacillus robiginosus]|uniref:staphylopine family metallophore export MFS transporter CntE n=1 Tax=Domibacillus robiginosus TaxID=1071054 RepID=UPI00067DCA19|nr:MFS transporter [Domibacillus robiginosus]
MNRRPLSASMIQLYALAVLFFTANSILTVVFPLQAAEGGYKEAEIGLMMGMYMFVCMVLRPWAGQMVARHSVFTIMKWLLVGHAAALLLYVWLGADSLVIVRALQGVVTAFFSMSMQIGITEAVSDEDRGQGMAMYSLSTVLPGLYGPALALLLWTGFDRSYLFTLMILLAVIPPLLLIRSPLPKGCQENASFTFRDMFAAVKEARTHRGLVLSSVIMLIGACTFGAITTFLPLFMLTEESGSPALFLFIQAVVVVASRFFLRKHIPSDGKWHPAFIALVLISSIIGTTLLALLPLLGSFVYISAVFNGLATALMYPALTTYLSFAVPQETRHILLGVFLASYDLGFSLGSFVMGFVVQFGSYSVMFTACSLITLLALSIVWMRREEQNVTFDKITLSK